MGTRFGSALSRLSYEFFIYCLSFFVPFPVVPYYYRVGKRGKILISCNNIRDGKEVCVEIEQKRKKTDVADLSVREKGKIVRLSHDILIKFFRVFPVRLVQGISGRSNWPGKSIPTRSKRVRV